MISPEFITLEAANHLIISDNHKILAAFRILPINHSHTPFRFAQASISLKRDFWLAYVRYFKTLDRNVAHLFEISKARQIFGLKQKKIVQIQHQIKGFDEQSAIQSCYQTKNQTNIFEFVAPLTPYLTQQAGQIQDNVCINRPQIKPNIRKMKENTAHISLIQLLLPIRFLLAVPHAQVGIPMPLGLAFLNKGTEDLEIVPIFSVLDDVPECRRSDVLPSLVLGQQRPKFLAQLLIKPLRISSIETLPFEAFHPLGYRLKLSQLLRPFSLLTPLIFATGTENRPVTEIQGIDMAQAILVESLFVGLVAFLIRLTHFLFVLYVLLYVAINIEALRLNAYV